MRTQTGVLALTVALAVVLAVALAPALVGAQVVCPNGGIDSDDDEICDSGWDEVCRCGNNVACNDNCVGFDNNAQLDFDCDGIGNGGLAGSPGAHSMNFRCDKCPLHYDVANLDTDGDGLGDACDCDRHNATVPRQAPCVRPRSNFLLIFFVCLGAGLLIAALIAWVCCVAGGGMRMLEGDAAEAAAAGVMSAEVDPRRYRAVLHY